MIGENTESPFEKFTENKLKIAKNRYRILAFFIDLFIFWLIGVIMAIFWGEYTEEDLSFHLKGIPALVLFLSGFLLWPVSEGLFGQTIGKRFLDLKVVSDTYKPIGIGQAFGRFFFGFIDYIFALGLIIAIIDKKNRRIGDMVSKTLVVIHKYKQS
ncbi:RDD family protein [Pontimicrobium sp. MEBiC06410]